MSDYKSVLEKIKVILGMETIVEDEVVLEETFETPETAEVVLAGSTLEDGTIVYHDGTLAVDIAVFTDEAMEIPVEDGTFVLENGDTFITAGGVITEYTPIVVEDEPVVEDETPLAEDFEKKYNDLKVVVDELKSKLENFSAKEIELKSEIDKLSIQPEVESISQEPQDKRESSDIEKRMNTLEAIRKMSS